MAIGSYGTIRPSDVSPQDVEIIMNYTPTRDVTDKPLFYLALVAMIIGTQLFLAGFLGELISRSSSDRNKYQIEKRV